MVLALTNGQRFGLAGTAAVFIAFALLSAFVIPRWRPEYPGRRGLTAFIVLTIVLTIAMLAAVELFAKEEEQGHDEPAREQAENEG